MPRALCKICGNVPPASNGTYCNPCRNEHYNRDYYKRTKESRCKARTEWRKRLREEVLQHYGGECECCGEHKKEFLCIDHIGGGGGKHRKTLNVSIYYWLRKNNFPSGFRVLCHNCNMAIGFYGICPHV